MKSARVLGLLCLLATGLALPQGAAMAQGGTTQSIYKICADGSANRLLTVAFKNNGVTVMNASSWDVGDQQFAPLVGYTAEFQCKQKNRFAITYSLLSSGSMSIGSGGGYLCPCAWTVQ